MPLLLQLFNQALLSATAPVLDLVARSVRALFFGLRAGAVEAGAGLPVASVISGFIVMGLIAAVLWVCARAAAKLRIKNPNHTATVIGRVAFWAGAVIGVYCAALLFYVLPQPDMPAQLYALLAGTTALYPIVGWVIRYVLGR